MNKIIERTLLSDDNCIIWTSSKKLVKYSEAIKQMDNRVSELIAGKEEGLVWFLEHPSLYTVGASSNLDDLLDKSSLPVYKTSRGGQITYHGPGQRIVYIMLNLKKIFYPNDPDLSQYVRLLEQTIIDFLAAVGIAAQRLDGSPGVWVKTKATSYKKIASIGIRVKKWICFHGVAVNISPDLEHFKGIIPCGIKEHGVTSVEDLGYKISVTEFDREFKRILEAKLRDASNI